ncbi:MAG: hypothetical protein V1909_03405 [Candidatus Micrarchaeota archaeon]
MAEAAETPVRDSLYGSHLGNEGVLREMAVHQPETLKVIDKVWRISDEIREGRWQPEHVVELKKIFLDQPSGLRSGPGPEAVRNEIFNLMRNGLIDPTAGSIRNSIIMFFLQCQNHHGSKVIFEMESVVLDKRAPPETLSKVLSLIINLGEIEKFFSYYFWENTPELAKSAIREKLEKIALDKTHVHNLEAKGTLERIQEGKIPVATVFGIMAKKAGATIGAGTGNSQSNRLRLA